MNSKASPIFRLVPSLTDVSFLMPIGMLFLVLNGTRTLLGDGDTGWHIRTGEWILANGHVPATDIFSYTRAGQPWFAWEWGWDVTFGWLHSHWGMEAVVIASMLTLCFTFALVYRMTLRKSGNALIAIAVTWAAMAASSIHWLARPHLFTLLFVVLFLSILEEAREGRRRLLFLLLPLTVFWTNLHGGFFVGIVLAGCYAIGEWIGAWLATEAEERKARLRQSLPFLFAAFGCMLASAANPYGYKLHIHIFDYLSEPYHRENIQEFMSASFQPALARFFEMFLALGVLTAGWKVRRREYAPAVLLISWAHLALVAGRNIPIYALVSAVWISEYLQFLSSSARRCGPEWLRKTADEWLHLAGNVTSLDRIPRVHIASLAVVVAVSAVIAAPGAAGRWRAEYDPDRYPKAALAAVRSFASYGGVFTDDEWGDYLAYSLYPSGKVFVDGRSDFYGPHFGNEFLSVLAVRHDWQHTLDHYGVHTILLPVKSALASTVKESKRWRVVYDDGIAVVFRQAGDPPDMAKHLAFVSNAPDRDPVITKPSTRDP